MTELAFLMDLLRNHKLSVTTRNAIYDRVANMSGVCGPPPSATPVILPPQIAAQPWASTQNAMARQQQIVGSHNTTLSSTDISLQKVSPTTVPVEVIAQTPAAAAAMASRAQAISESISGKTDKITGRPRKF